MNSNKTTKVKAPVPVKAPAPVKASAPVKAPAPLLPVKMTTIQPVRNLSGKNILIILLGILAFVILISGVLVLMNKSIYKHTNLISTTAKIVGHMDPSCENVVDTENSQQIMKCQMNIQYYVNEIEYNKTINANNLSVKPQIGDEIDVEYDPDNPNTVVMCCTYFKRRGMYLITISLILLLLLLYVIIKRN